MSINKKITTADCRNWLVAASQVIRDLLESMAMPDECLEAAARVVLRRLDALEAE